MQNVNNATIKSKENMMKRIISFALILTLTIFCGIQLMAGDADTFAVCNHEGYIFGGDCVDRSYTNMTEDYHMKVYVYEYVCVKCGKVWNEREGVRESHHFIDNPDDPDFNWCTLCDGVYKK